MGKVGALDRRERGRRQHISELEGWMLKTSAVTEVSEFVSFKVVLPVQSAGRGRVGFRLNRKV